MIFNWKRQLFCLYLWTAGGLCDGKRWPSACVPSARHLPDFHRAARHPAHALRLPPGLCQREQGQHRLPVLAQLVCADRQGERENACKDNRSNGRVGYVCFDQIPPRPPDAHMYTAVYKTRDLKMERNQRSPNHHDWVAKQRKCTSNIPYCTRFWIFILHPGPQWRSLA